MVGPHDEDHSVADRLGSDRNRPPRPRRRIQDHVSKQPRSSAHTRPSGVIETIRRVFRRRAGGHDEEVGNFLGVHQSLLQRAGIRKHFREAWRRRQTELNMNGRSAEVGVQQENVGIAFQRQSRRDVADAHALPVPGRGAGSRSRAGCLDAGRSSCAESGTVRWRAVGFLNGSSGEGAGTRRRCDRTAPNGDDGAAGSSAGPLRAMGSCGFGRWRLPPRQPGRPGLGIRQRRTESARSPSWLLSISNSLLTLLRSFDNSEFAGHP